MSDWERRNEERAKYMPVFEDLKLAEEAHDFFGVDQNCFKLGNEIFEVLENEGDGYRSSMDYVKPRTPHGLIFFGTAVDSVKLVDAPDHPEGTYGVFEGWQLVSAKDGHIWLTFGTDNADDYYPCFTFRYTPRAP